MPPSGASVQDSGMDDRAIAGSVIQRMPPEIFLAILRLLAQADLARAMRVCRQWHTLAAPVLWREPKLFHPIHYRIPQPLSVAEAAVPTPDSSAASTSTLSSSSSSSFSSSTADIEAIQRRALPRTPSHAHLPTPPVEVLQPPPPSVAASPSATDNAVSEHHIEDQPPAVVVSRTVESNVAESDSDPRRIFRLFKRRSAVVHIGFRNCQDPQREMWHLFLQSVCGPDWHKRPGLGQQLISRCSALLFRGFQTLGGSDTSAGCALPTVEQDRTGTAPMHIAHRSLSLADLSTLISESSGEELASRRLASTKGASAFPTTTTTNTAAAAAATTDLNALRSPPNTVLTGTYGTLIDRLDLSRACLRVSDHAMRQLAEHCPKLRVINLSNCLRLTDSAVLALAEHCSLEAVNLTNCQQLTTASTFALAQHCPRLRSLCLAGCPLTVDDATAVALTQGCSRHLAYLRIGGNFQLSDVGVKALAEGCGARLLWLDIGQCPLLSDAAVHALADHCPQLEWLDLTKGFPMEHSKYTQQLQLQQQRAQQHQHQLMQQQQDQWARAQQPVFQHHSGGASTPVAVGTTVPLPELPAEVQQLAYSIPSIEARFFAGISGSLPMVTDTSVCRLVEKCPRLRLLNLNGRAALTDVTLHAVSVHCMNLRSLTISGCNKVTTDAVKRLGSDRIGWVGMSPCPNVSFAEVCAASKWKVISLQDVPQFHLNLMNGQSWDDVGTERAR